MDEFSPLGSFEFSLPKQGFFPRGKFLRVDQPPILAAPRIPGLAQVVLLEPFFKIFSLTDVALASFAPDDIDIIDAWIRSGRGSGRGEFLRHAMSHLIPGN